MCAMPNYVPRRADVQAAQPGVIEDAKLYTFVFDGSYDAINAFTDEFLNVAPSNELTYKALLPTVLVSFLDAEKLTSEPDPYGWVPDKECSVWVLLGAFENGVLKRVVWWMPYVWVDTAVAMATGREVWGFEKTMGRMRIPQSPVSSPVFRTKARVFKRLLPATQGKNKPIITVCKTGAGSSLWGQLEHAWRDEKAAAYDFWKRIMKPHLEIDLANVGVIGEVLGKLINLDIPMVNLRQLRDTADHQKAAVQQIIESDIKMTSFTGGGFLSGNWKMKLFPCESHPINTDFGLGSNVVSATEAFWVHNSFKAMPGKVVWDGNDP